MPDQGPAHDHDDRQDQQPGQLGTLKKPGWPFHDRSFSFAGNQLSKLSLGSFLAWTNALENALITFISSEYLRRGSTLSMV